MTILSKALGTLIVAGLAIQVVPFGHKHTNPPVLKEPAWDKPETRDLARRACFNCHSNETVWPWYSSVAPVSWLTQRDVNDGRRRLNFSEFSKPQRRAHDAAEEVQKGDMPPWFYVPMHPESKLTSVERDTLIAGLGKTLGMAQGGDEHEGHGK